MNNTATSYYRIHPANKAPESILDAGNWQSRVWVGERYKRCEACNGEGRVDDSWDDGEKYHYEWKQCDACDGAGEVEDVRRGVSCCESVEDLKEYFADRGAEIEGCWLIELEGELSDDDDHDAGSAGDPQLVLPSAVISAVRITQAWLG
jgi:hypothetical protein